jgi:hypothetical protein
MGFKLLDRWKLASAIRKEELIEILYLLVQSAQGSKSRDRAGAEGDPARRAADPWRAALLKSFEQLNEKPADELTLAASEMKKVFAEDSAKAEQVIAQLMRTAGQFTGSIDRWFDAMMDRVSQDSLRKRASGRSFFRVRCSRVASGRAETPHATFDGRRNAVRLITRMRCQIGQ